MVGPMTALAVHLVVTDPDSAAAWYTDARHAAQLLGGQAQLLGGQAGS
jgi:hypothetical protein